MTGEFMQTKPSALFLACLSLSTTIGGGQLPQAKSSKHKFDRYLLKEGKNSDFCEVFQMST